METYLPLINSTLTQFYRMTIDNYLYAATIAALVWLLTAVFYSIRIAFLKRKNRKTEQARVAAVGNLETLQQQLQQSQDELAQTVGQIEQDKTLGQQQQQRLAIVEGLVGQRNKQIAELIQVLATQLDLGERPILVSEDIKADDVWQQHSRVIKQLVDRVRSEQQTKVELQQTYQAETAKLAERDALLTTLRTTLDLQNSQLANLELALAEQKSLLQQQQGKTQQVLADLTEKYQAELTNIAPSKPFAVEPVIAVADNLIDDSSNRAFSASSFQKEYKPAEIVEEVNEVAQSVVTSFEETIAQPVLSSVGHQIDLSMPTETTQSPQYTTEPLQPTVIKEQYDVPTDLAEPVVEPVSNESVNKSATGMSGKLKNLFTKKQSVNKAPVEPTVSKPKSTGTQKVKGWLGKVTSKNK